MADPEVLLYDISGFRNYLISLYFIFSEFGRSRVFSHDTVSDLIEGQKIPVGFTGISFISIYFFDFLFGMTAVNSTIREEVRSYF